MGVNTFGNEQFARKWTLDMDMEKYESSGEDKNHLILIWLEKAWMDLILGHGLDFYDME